MISCEATTAAALRVGSTSITSRRDDHPLLSYTSTSIPTRSTSQSCSWPESSTIVGGDQVVMVVRFCNLSQPQLQESQEHARPAVDAIKTTSELNPSGFAVWLCHNGDPTCDCFYLWHKNRELGSCVHV